MVRAEQKQARLNRYRTKVVGVFGVALIFISGCGMNAQALKAPVLTPPMGWNSYDCYGYSGSARVSLCRTRIIWPTNLKKYGWEYCVVDFIWVIPAETVYMGTNQSGNWNFGNMDQYGRFMPDTTRFPSAKGGKGFKPLADSVHNLGLKFGLHLMRGVPKMAVQRGCGIYNSTYTCTQAADQTSTCPWMDWM